MKKAKTQKMPQRTAAPKTVGGARVVAKTVAKPVPPVTTRATGSKSTPKVSAKTSGKVKSSTSAKTKVSAPKAVSAPAAKKVAAKSTAHPSTGRAKKPVPGKAATKPAGKVIAGVQPKLKLVSDDTPPVRMVPNSKTVPDKVRIFQIYYRSEQRQHLDPAFEPYNNEGDSNPLLEFNVFRKLMNSELVRDAELWGALSWKFKEKTGLSGEQLRQIIASNPGYDVYYCNPFPELEGLYHNLWLQGDTCHPNFLILCSDFFRAAGLDEDVLTQLVPSQLFAASNYFVASPGFWRDYLDFVAEVIARAEQGMSSTAKAMIYSSAADRKAVHAGASYMPFIVERLFGIYLRRTQGRYRAYKFSCEPVETKLNVHQKLLRQMKDVAISSKSLWMVTCWVNYRNLYLQQAHGADWCSRHLRSITPVSVTF